MLVFFFIRIDNNMLEIEMFVNFWGTFFHPVTVPFAKFEIYHIPSQISRDLIHVYIAYPTNIYLNYLRHLLIKLWYMYMIHQTHLNVYSSPKTTQIPISTEHDKNDLILVELLIGTTVFISCFSILMLYLYRKKRGEFIYFYTYIIIGYCASHIALIKFLRIKFLKF